MGGKWRFHHTLDACARSPKVRERYVALQRGAVARITKAAAAGQRAGEVRRDIDDEAIAEILVVLSMGIAASLDAGIPFDLQRGARAMLKLLRPR